MTDQQVRAVMKYILHLHPRTTDHVLYARKGMVVWGFPVWQSLSIWSASDRGWICWRVGTLLIGQRVRRAVSRIAARKSQKFMRLNWPVTPKDLVRASQLNKYQESKYWEILASQVQGVMDFRNDPLGNSWLYDPTALSSSRYTDALRLRTNMFGVNVALSRADKGLPVDCRCCKEKSETLGHVLGECVAGKGTRIQSHDIITAVIATKCEEKGYRITRQQLFSVREDRHKPDLVTDGERALNVDVTVRFESGDALVRGTAEKIAKYQPLAD
jgi:hypothetical protein